MNEACETNNAENVKPRIDESRDDSTEITSRIEGHTPVGGPLGSAEVNSRSDGVLPLRERGSVEGGLPDPGKDATLENADSSELCINEMTVILKSLDVASASERVAELFFGKRFGDSMVDTFFGRGIVADYATGWMNHNMAQQRLYAKEQRVSWAGERPSVATRVEAAQQIPDDSMGRTLAARSAKEASAPSNAKEVLAASSTRKACATSDVDVVENNQMGGENSAFDWVSNVLHHRDAQNVVERLVRRPGGQGVITMMCHASRVNEVKYKNFVDQCVRHLEKREMCQVLGNAGKLLLHENLWDWWSRGLSFVKKIAESDGMHKNKE